MARLNHLYIFIVLFITCTLIATSCSAVVPPDTETPAADKPEKPSPGHVGTQSTDYMSPLYLSVIIHSEEDIGANNSVKNNIPDYDGDENVFRHFSNAIRKFALIAAQHGAAINFGTEWTFARGVKSFNPSFFTDLEAMGHSIDAHAHETHIDYHAVRANITNAGAGPTCVASGIDEADIYGKMEYFDTYYPEFRIFWGIASPGHGAGEPVAGWVWRPSVTDWEQHDPDGRYINIGGGEGVNSIEAIKAAVANRRENYINTYSVFIAPREFKAETGTAGIHERWTVTKKDCAYWENKLGWWNDFFTEIDTLVAQGDIQYASLTEVADTFEQNEADLIFPAGPIPRSGASIRERNIEAGYCVSK